MSDEPTVQSRLNRVGARVLAAATDCGVHCYFRVLKSSVPNAFSIPEGGVYITEGLYRRLSSEEALAAALAHEVAHVAEGHGRRRSKGRDDQLRKEIAADLKAADYLAAAGYDGQALDRLIRMLSGEQHPGWAERRTAALKNARNPRPTVVQASFTPE